MMSNIIPTATRLAAKRGFVRTATQALSTAIPTGAITITLTGSFAIGAALAVGNALVTALLAGAQSYLSITSKGVPAEYTQAGIVNEAVPEEPPVAWSDEELATQEVLDEAQVDLTAAEVEQLDEAVEEAVDEAAAADTETPPSA